MEGSARYEIIDTIASGDFAVVYRGRDRELGREVAIKQIHQQYLADSRLLSRFWQEAQLLASLQHPNILTIYDIVRSKGCLILELMHGSLLPAAQSDGIDLDYLRMAMAGCLNALQFLHANGVIHCDIKPSNLLIDAQGRVKLGDFGLARRVCNESGSLLKGTTKYMAPEMLSPQFGPVGPASDLYSLGFVAYELMCGAQFESLFPGLSSFGRDKQIAWLMWHAAPDRVLPPIRRVLEGVPDDLARVVEKLIVKDQTRRYQSAKDVLWELRPAVPAIAQKNATDAAVEAAQAAAAKRKRKLRFAAVLAVAFSAILCTVMLLPQKPKPVVAPPAPPPQGTVLHVYPEEYRIALKVVEMKDGKENERIEEIRLAPRYDKVLINDNVEPLDQIQPNDFVRLETVRDAAGRRIHEVYAYRPTKSQGVIQSVEAEKGQFVLTVVDEHDSSKKPQQLTLDVPKNMKISFNGNAFLAGKPVTLTDLKPGDRVVARHIGKQFGYQATELNVERIVTLKGIVRDIQVNKAKDKCEAVLETGTGEKAEVVTLPFAGSCEIAVNNLSVIKERRFKPTDLMPGDRVTVTHDTRIVRVEANRINHDTGTIEKVQSNAIEVLRTGEKTPTRYSVGNDCEVTFNGDATKLGDLREGDVVEIAHRSLDGRNPDAVSVAARRGVDRRRWAILIGMQDYEDRRITPLEYSVADVKLLGDTLATRYQVPSNQIAYLTDESLVRLEQSIPDQLGRIESDAAVLVYFAGHAYKDEDGAIYLAPKNFDLKRMRVTGLPLQWLVDVLEKCRAKEKLLLLDCSHAGQGQDLAQEPSTAEMLRLLKAPPGRSPLHTVTAIASCKAGQRGADWPEKQHGMFGWFLAQAYAGAADKNRDNRLESTELFSYLQDAMTTVAAQLKIRQKPELFLPDDRPPRLSDKAKTAIRKLAADILQRPTNRAHLEEAEKKYTTASVLAGKEMEPQLLYGLLLLKENQRDQAVKRLQELDMQHPELLLPLQGIVWARFEKRLYPAGIDELTKLISKIPQPKKPGSPYTEEQQQVFYWAGRLREFAALTAEEGRKPSDSAFATLDSAVSRHGADAEKLYRDGQAKSRETYRDFGQRLATAETEADTAKLKIERRRSVHYVDFPYDQSVRRILGGLDQ